MRSIIIFLFTCVCAYAQAQVNFVKNPSFEEFTKCPDNVDQIVYTNFWSGNKDTLSDSIYQPEYFNSCANKGVDFIATIPFNMAFYQNAHYGNGMAGATFYYDKTPPPFVGLSNYRQYIQGHLLKPLIVGRTYCVSFWVNLAEGSGYAQNKIGAYLDNGNINKLPILAGEEVTTLTPQIFTNSVLVDTLNWVKIEGSFIATGNENHITIGNFFSNTSTTVLPTNYWMLTTRISYYLLDDVSVIPIDLDVQAGADTWVEQGSKRKIGRIDDSATVLGLDCKWYKKGVLIDSGAIISVYANAVKYAVDTYVVVQTICGVVKSDTVLVKTVGLGVHEFGFENTFIIFPNPSNGTLNISASFEPNSKIIAKVYDLLGRELFRNQLSFSNKQGTLKLDVPNGTYLLELQDEVGNVQRERIVIN